MSRKELARKKWLTAMEMYVELCDALGFAPDGRTDEAMHNQLQYQLDRISRIRKEARAEYPDVEDSFTIATFTMKVPR